MYYLKRAFGPLFGFLVIVNTKLVDHYCNSRLRQ